MWFPPINPGLTIDSIQQHFLCQVFPQFYVIWDVDKKNPPHYQVEIILSPYYIYVDFLTTVN